MKKIHREYHHPQTMGGWRLPKARRKAWDRFPEGTYPPDTLDLRLLGSRTVRQMLKSSSLRYLIIAAQTNCWFPWWLSGKEFACQCKVLEFDPWVGKIPWKRKWEPTPVFLPGKFHGQRSSVGYSPWDLTELDMTERTHAHAEQTDTDP